MSKIGRNEPCPCGSGKKYKRCCESSGTYERIPQLGPEPQHGPEDFGMVIALKPRRKLQTSPAAKLRRAANNEHPDDVIAQGFMGSLIPVINACHQAGDALKKATGHDVFHDLCKLLNIAETNVPEEVLKTMLSPFAYLRHFTYTPETRSFFDDFVAKELQHTPNAIDLYEQLTNQSFDVWDFAPSPDKTYTTRIAFTDPATHKSREIDGFFCLSDGIPSNYHLACPVHWQGFDLLISLGAFESAAIARQHTVIDIHNPDADTKVPFYYNEHTAIQSLADPHTLFAPASPQKASTSQTPSEEPNAFTKLFK